MKTKTERMALLHALANQYANTPFIMAKTDCNILMMQILEIYINLDCYAKMVEQYKTYRDGAILGKLYTGCGDFKELFKQYEADGIFELVNQNELITGDIILFVNNPFYTSTGVQIGDDVFIAKHATQMVHLEPLDFSDLEEVSCYRLKEV